MFTVYLYIFDTMADWEIGHAVSELGSGRFFKADAPEVSFKTVGLSEEPVKTMGGLHVIPDGVIGSVGVNAQSVLLLPGGNTWEDPKHGPVIQKAAELLDAGGAVCAICGATAALARAGLLDRRRHTSNGAGFLETFCPGYQGTAYYVDEPAAADGGLITAGAHGALQWAREILAYLGVFRADTLEEWYAYFQTGDARHFYKMMQTLPSGGR